jgi:hemoglobin
MDVMGITHKEGMMGQGRGIGGIVVLTVLVSVGAVWAENPKGKSLYERLGGKEAISAVVETFVGKVGADKRINGFFASTDLTKLKVNLVNQICEGSGGPCKYTGRTMKQTHAGMGVTDAAFGALVEDLVSALDQHKVGKAEKEELLGILGPMKGDIVEKK